MKRPIIFITIAALSLIGCNQNAQRDKAEEIAISRALEQAVELSEKIISEKELIENVALTQGTDAALALARKEIIAHLYPYAARLDNLLEQIS